MKIHFLKKFTYNHLAMFIWNGRFNSSIYICFITLVGNLNYLGHLMYISLDFFLKDYIRIIGLVPRFHFPNTIKFTTISVISWGNIPQLMKIFAGLKFDWNKEYYNAVLLNFIGRVLTFKNKYFLFHIILWHLCFTRH